MILLGIVKYDFGRRVAFKITNVVVEKIILLQQSGLQYRAKLRGFSACKFM